MKKPVGDNKIVKRLDIARKIAYYLTGCLTAEETKELEHWIQETPENEAEVKNIRKMAATGMERPDMEEMWKDFERKLPRQKKMFMYFRRYAAVLLIPVCVAVYLYLNRDNTTPTITHIAEKQQIEPGNIKARLIFADGSCVDLKKESEGQILEKNGLQVLVSEEGIHYQTKPDTRPNQTISLNTLLVPRGGEYSLQLADGTKVWLNADSRLKYPVVFSGNSREVELEGEAYFEIKQDITKPFIVKAYGCDITALGTSFNVTAYGKDLITTLVEGKLKLDKDEQSVILMPDQQAVWEENKNGFRVQRVDAKNYILWKEGVFRFDDINLESILDNLARWYDFQISYTTPELKTMRFSLEMKRYQEIGTVLNKIAYTGKVRFKIQDRNITVSK